MNKETFLKLCKKHNIKLGDLPAFPQKFSNMTESKWDSLLKSISEAKNLNNLKEKL